MDSEKEFDGIGPDGQDLNWLETMFKVANHPIQHNTIKAKPLFQSVQ